jgi:hypothetical protein
MNWILDHLQIVIAVAAAIAAWLQQRRKGAAGTGDGESGETVTGEDDQTRRIQEEIRRKIAERRGQAAPAPASPDPSDEPWHDPAPPVMSPRPVAQELPPVLRDIFAKRIEETRRREEAAARARAQAERERLQQEEQQEAAAREQVAALHRRQVQAQRDAEAAAGTAAVAARAAWRKQLLEPQQIRQAIVLREVLGPPAGLR